MKYFITTMLLLLTALTTQATDNRSGAMIFYDRCVLCHGMSGMGEGILPLKIKDYPKTNLLESAELTRAQIKNVIMHGSADTNSLKLMPPMKDELGEEKINLLTDFVLLIREDNKQASALLKRIASKAPPNTRTGEHLYATRCVLCHGKQARGDGRMAKVIKSPPPADLIDSKAGLNYIMKIVEHGGAAMGRSPQMPPWGDQFSESEIESIALYILELREEEN